MNLVKGQILDQIHVQSWNQLYNQTCYVVSYQVWDQLQEQVYVLISNQIQEMIEKIM